MKMNIIMIIKNLIGVAWKFLLKKKPTALLNEKHQLFLYLKNISKKVSKCIQTFKFYFILQTGNLDD